MSILQKDSVVKNVLKNLCRYYGWSFGAFWSYNQPNSLLLTLQDAYFEENFGSLINNLLLQVPIGGGIIGQAAYSNKHTWMSSEDQYNEFHPQFSSGMKTIAVIPLETQGVVQFGSSEKILENMEFVNQTKRMFQEIVNGEGSEVGLTFLNGQICNQNEDFSSITLSQKSCFNEFPDFGIPNEFFQTQDFDVSQWFPELNPIDFNQNHEPLTISGTNVDFFGNNGDFGDILTPVISGNQSHSGLHSYNQIDHTALGPKEKLFTKLGIEELLEGVSSISNAGLTSCIDGQTSAKRRKTENCTVFQANEKFEPQKPVKKKKAKPGTRPRPKDRQLILDRMAELRQLIPNGEKMSIDCLLDRTIKHMIFLENVTKQAEKIKKADERKLNGPVSNDPNRNGVTWACELGNQAMVCPLIVEDLGAPGQMLIEMLCEEQGFFLEIVDIIRHFGLIILKGVMETRNDKIWARFIVEPEDNKHVTRHEIFSVLVQFLQMATPIFDDKCTKPESCLPNNFHESGMYNLVNFANMQYCVNLDSRML